MGAASLLVCAVASTLAGCAGGGLSRPAVPTPSAFQASAGATDATLSPAVLDAWWRLYSDPQLSALIEEALQRSPDARIGLQRIAQSRASRAQALSAYLPQGELVGSAQQQHTDESIAGLGVTTGLATGGSAAEGAGGTGAGSAELTPAGSLQTYAAAFNVTYELDLFGRRRAARRAADNDVLAQRFDYEAVRSTLATNVASALFQARGAAIQLEEARETLRIAHQLAVSADVSAAHGLTSTSDAARLESEAATDGSEVARLEGLARADRRSLLDLVGRGTAPIESLIVQPLAQPPPAPPATAPGDLLRRRPDVREAEARLHSAAGQLDLDRLALLPDFQLAPGYQIAKTAGAYASLTNIWTVGLNAAMPVLDRPRLLAIVRGQRAAGEEAVAAYERSVQDAYRDAENGLNTLSADRRRAASLQTAVERARFAFDAKRRGYDLGLTDLTTLLASETTWRTAQSSFTAAQVAALVDSAALFQALGGGWTPPPADAGARPGTHR